MNHGIRRMHRSRVRCAHFRGRVEAHAEALTHDGWKSQLCVEGPTAHDALDGLLHMLPDWQGVEVRHTTMAAAA